MTIRRGVAYFLLALLVSFNCPAGAQADQLTALHSDLTPMEETSAYKDFERRPTTELSKLLFLIERFSDSNVEILYNSTYFNSRFAARVARWFLTRHYGGETVGEWITAWCSTAVPSGKLIWVRFPNGDFKLGREILLEELELLDHILAERSAVKNVEAETSAVAEMVSSPADVATQLPPEGQAITGPAADPVMATAM